MAKILIAEDERPIRDIISRIVEQTGHAAIKCSNGRAAWDILCFNPDIKLLITDVSMPEMNGDELVSKIRQDKDLSEMPALIISGAIRAKDIAHLLKLGATAFLPKPVSIKDLRAYIHKFIPETAEQR